MQRSYFFWLVSLWCRNSALCSWWMFKINTFLNVFFGHISPGNIQLHFLLCRICLLWTVSFNLPPRSTVLWLRHDPRSKFPKWNPLSHSRLACSPLWSTNGPNTHGPLLWETQQVCEFFTWPPHLPLLFEEQGRLNILPLCLWSTTPHTMSVEGPDIRWKNVPHRPENISQNKKKNPPPVSSKSVMIASSGIGLEYRTSTWFLSWKQ